MNVMPESVTYPALQIQNHAVCVEFFNQQQAGNLTSQMLDVIVASYSHQFEQVTPLLPAGTFATRYQTDETFECFRDSVIPAVYERDGTYVGVRSPLDPNQLLSVCKVLPGVYIEERFSGMTAVAEVLTTPAYQKRSLGSAMILAYLAHDLPKRGVVLSAFENNPVNEWYRAMGLEYEEPCLPLIVGDGLELPQRYMVTPSSRRSSDVAAYLCNKQVLQETQVVY